MLRVWYPTEWPRAQPRECVLLPCEALRVCLLSFERVKVRGRWGALAGFGDARVAVEDGVEGPIVDSGAQSAVVVYDAALFC